MQSNRDISVSCLSGMRHSEVHERLYRESEAIKKKREHIYDPHRKENDELRQLLECGDLVDFEEGMEEHTAKDEAAKRFRMVS